MTVSRSPLFLLGRVLLRFDTPAHAVRGNLSAAALTPDGLLWLGADEGTAVERLTRLDAASFGDHQPFDLAGLLDGVQPDQEIDIEGLDYADNYLWFTGSHSAKRKRPKGKTVEQDLERLSEIKTEPNRYLLGRVPLAGGLLHRTCTHPAQPDRQLAAARLQPADQGNALVDALRADPHLGPFFTFPLPGKENGFDVEGLAVRGDRLLLGLRGPVLRGWAIILELEGAEEAPGILTLTPFADEGRSYRKRLLDLDGLGVRDLLLYGDDLFILAGPTLTLSGANRIFRLREVFAGTGDTLTGQAAGRLELVGELPQSDAGDNAEGLALCTWLDQPALLVVYDTPDPRRIPGPGQVLADLFPLPQ